VLVVAELEVGERVRTVSPHQLACGSAHLSTREDAWHGERPEEQVGAPDEREDPGDADRLVEVAELVLEVERPGLPEQRVAGLAQDRPEAGALGRGDPDGEAAEEQARGGEQLDAAQRRTQRVRVVTDVERVPSEPEHDAGGDAARSRLDVEPLHKVEHGQPGEQRERKPQRALPAAPEVRRRHEQQHRGRHRERVCEPQRLERLDVEQQVVSPRDVRLDRGGKVDEPGQRGNRSG
jgi:hypothetical protein